MKITFILLTLFVISCSTPESRNELREHYRLQYSHGFYILTEKEVGKLSADYRLMDATKAKRGAKIYKTTCMKCHGVSGKGNGPKAIWEQPPANLVKMIQAKPFQFYFNEKRWQERMPGWEMKLSKEQVEDLRHYLMSLAK